VRDDRDATAPTPALSEETADDRDALRRLRWERRQAWYEAMQRAEWVDALARRRWLRAHPPAGSAGPGPAQHGSRRDNLGTRLRLKAQLERAARLAQKTEEPDE
jgi:hypothetical protein